MAKGKYTEEDFESYLDNELDAAQRSEFELALSEDAQLLDELVLHRELKAGMMAIQMKQTSVTLRQIPISTSTAFFSQFRIIGIAAMLLFITTFCIWLFINDKLSPREDQFLAYYVPPVSTIERSDQNNEAVISAISAFRQRDYKRSLELLEDLPEALAQDEILTFWKGHAAFQSSDYEKASGYFDALISSENKALSIDAQWINVLSNLMAGKEEDAKSSLLKIVKDPGHPYQKRAGELLSIL